MRYVPLRVAAPEELLEEHQGLTAREMSCMTAAGRPGRRAAEAK